MKKRIFLIALMISATRAHATSHSHQLCEGFLPENNMYIPESEVHAQGVTRAKFDEILNRVYNLYRNEVSRLGGSLVIQRKWSDGTVNAYAFRQGRSWVITMFGGFARHRSITYDGFASVACHEMGHHLGGAPIIRGDDWASNEGQSDYYATTKCLKRLFEKDDNDTILAGMRLDPLAVRKCEAEHRSKQDQQLCIRVAMAGVSLAGVLVDLEGGGPTPRLDTPDRRLVSRTDDNHPRGQCRLDTYFQGALCTVGQWTAVSNRDYRVGYCADSRTYSAGLRPRCWFKPN